jgi:hypothetical protein
LVQVRPVGGYRLYVRFEDEPPLLVVLNRGVAGKGIKDLALEFRDPLGRSDRTISEGPKPE